MNDLSNPRDLSEGKLCHSERFVCRDRSGSDTADKLFLEAKHQVL